LKVAQLMRAIQPVKTPKAIQLHRNTKDASALEAIQPVESLEAI